MAQKKIAIKKHPDQHTISELHEILAKELPADYPIRMHINVPYQKGQLTDAAIINALLRKACITKYGKEVQDISVGIQEGTSDFEMITEHKEGAK